MNRSLLLLTCFALTLGFSSVASGQPAFDLTLEPCPAQIDLPAEEGGSTVTRELTAVVTPSGLQAGDDGAQGWSLSLTADGGTIVAVTTSGTAGAEVTEDPPGLRDGGFEKSETTPVDGNAGAGDCAANGNVGAVSAVVLSFTMPVTLDPVAPSDLLKVTVEATAPDAPATPDDPPNCADLTVRFADGCQGSGQPVNNRVTLNGETQFPALGSCTTTICVLPAPPDCTGAALNLILTAEAAQPEPHESGVVDDGLVGDVDDPVEIAREAAAGAPAQVTVYGAIVSNGLASGVQGWSLSGRVTGDLLAAAVTTDGTAGAETPGGLRNGGFEKSETISVLNPEPDPPPTSWPDVGTIHPDTGEPQGEGFVSAVVLSFTMPITLLPVGTATALAVTVQTANDVEDGVTQTGAVEWFDNMTGSGQPVKNVATVAGGTETYCATQGANVTVTALQVNDFLRCDPNDDGKSNIADAIWIVNELFRGGPATGCAEAANCNGEGEVDLSDAAYAIAYQFLETGAPPPGPFPNCEVAETLEECLTYTSECPAP